MSLPELTRTADTRNVATLTGWLMVITFVTSIPAYFFFYAPVLENPDLITGAGADPTVGVALGAVLEIILIVANVGTAVVPYAVFKRYSDGLALGYVAARLIECTFIAVGVASLLTFTFMRQEGTAAADGALGEVFVAIYDRAFLLGPGVFAGVANGMILGYLMYRSGLVPRGMAVLGLVGGPLVAASGGRRHVRPHRSRGRRAGDSDDSGIHLGVVVRHLSDHQGVQVGADSRSRTCELIAMSKSDSRLSAFLRPWSLWTVGFLAFPIAGLAGTAVAGRVDSPLAALLGGAVVGLVIGAGQTLTSSRRLDARWWIPATTIGMGPGLLLGAWVVGYRTSLADLALMGALTGVVLGVAQAIALPRRTRGRWIWAVAMPVLWTLGWTATTLGGISVENQFTVFGAYGALTFSALSGVLLHWLLPPRHLKERGGTGPDREPRTPTEATP